MLGNIWFLGQLLLNGCDGGREKCRNKTGTQDQYANKPDRRTAVQSQQHRADEKGANRYEKSYARTLIHWRLT